VRLVAVSKLHPASVVAEAAAAGQILFGENYVQELCDKAHQIT
jgi:PLP dependent protein